MKDTAVRPVHPEAIFPRERPRGFMDGSSPWYLKRGFPRCIRFIHDESFLAGLFSVSDPTRREDWTWDSWRQLLWRVSGWLQSEKCECPRVTLSTNAGPLSSPGGVSGALPAGTRGRRVPLGAAFWY